MSARSHPRRLIVSLVTGSLLVLGSLAGWSGQARAVGMAFSASSCVTTASTVVPGVQIADPACEFNGAAYTGPFSPIANSSGQLSRVWTGIASDGSAYRVEVPPHWNGTLVMFAVRRALSDPAALRDAVAGLIESGQVDADQIDAGDPLGFLRERADVGSVVEAAYRFCRHEPGAQVVLTGTGDVAHLEANVAAIQGPPLATDVQDRLRALFGRVDTLSGN